VRKGAKVLLGAQDVHGSGEREGFASVDALEHSQVSRPFLDQVRYAVEYGSTLGNRSFAPRAIHRSLCSGNGSFDLLGITLANMTHNVCGGRASVGQQPAARRHELPADEVFQSHVPLFIEGSGARQLASDSGRVLRGLKQGVAVSLRGLIAEE
jgi:hypothetical protein